MDYINVKFINPHKKKKSLLLSQMLEVNYYSKEKILKNSKIMEKEWKLKKNHLIQNPSE